MYAIYGNMDPINIPQMLAYIPAPWIRHGIYEGFLSHRNVGLPEGIFFRWVAQPPTTVKPRSNCSKAMRSESLSCKVVVCLCDILKIWDVVYGT
jgi:hypothetical protein